MAESGCLGINLIGVVAKKMIDVIYRAALHERFEAECVGECSCCKHNYETLNGMGSCALINEAPIADDVVSKEVYDDLYAKYCELARLYNGLLSKIMKMAKNVGLFENDNHSLDVDARATKGG